MTYSAFYVMIEGVKFTTNDPNFPDGARLLTVSPGTGPKMNRMDFQVNGGPYAGLSNGVNTGRILGRAVILTVDPGGGDAGNEAKIRSQTLFDVIVVRYKFLRTSAFTLSFSRSVSAFGWVPLVFSAARFEDQSPVTSRKPQLRQP
jgi:hypothetical protein